MTPKYKRLLLFIVCFTLSVNVLAVKFYSVNSLFGISTRVTNSICKDDNGFIWASSKTGILRLTNDDCRIYQLPYETEGVLIVRLMYENSKLIAYTNNGQVFIYNPVFDRFDLLFNMSGMLNNKNFYVFTLLTDNNNDFWIALDIGLYKYHSGKLDLIDETLTGRYLITWFDDQQLIVANSEGIRTLDTQSFESEYIFLINNTNPFSVSSLFFDKNQKKLWVGTMSNGLFCYNFDSASFSHVLQSTLPRQPVLAVKENSDSSMLIGIDGQGIWELDKNSREVLNVYKERADDPNSLPGNGVYDIFCDDGKRVWVATISGGVSFYELTPPTVTQIVHHLNSDNSLVNNDVNSILEDSDGKIWFATNNGISVWNPVSNQWLNFYNNKLEHAQVFLTLCEDVRGRIWAGSYSSGVYVLNRTTGKELAHYARGEEGSPVVGNFIFDIFEDSGHDLWIGGVNGEFMCYQSKENTFRTYSEESISSFAELSPEQILLGFSYGLSVLNKKTGEIKNLLQDIVTQDIVVLGDEIWICTSGQGLLEYNFKSGTTQKFTTESGLPSNFINSIVYANNYLWLGTESGLCRFDPNDKSTLTFSSVYPLSEVSYNKSAVSALNKGELAWGTNHGAIFFHPDSLKEISSEGKIYFHDFTVSGRSLRDTSVFKLNTPVNNLERVDLKYFQNTISLEMIPVGVNPGTKFSWKLEEFDSEWATPSENRIITYTNLPSGEFDLKVKLYDSSLEHILSERSISIHLIPPLWKKGWFLFLISLFISGIIILILLYYINNLKQKHTEEKVRFFTNTAHDIRTALTLIKAPVEELTHEKNLTDKGKQYLQIAVNQARQLSSVVTQLMDFQKVDIGKEITSLSMVDIVKLISTRKMMYESLAENKNIHLTFRADRESYKSAVDESKMEKVIDNLISNAVKYSHNNGQVDIEFSADKSKWTLLVKDNGIGMSKKAQRMLFKEFYRGENAMNSKIVGSGIGLLLVKNYVTLHGGTVSCESLENVGSSFQVVVPYKEIRETEPLKQYSTEPELSFDLTDGRKTENESFIENSSSKKMCVLIAEDNDDLRNFIANKTEGEFTTLVAADGEIAWKLIQEKTPDLVISDVMMPVMDGFELCKRVKSTYETSHIPLILLTALTDKAEQLHGLGLGADDYLTKPFDMSLLIQKIRTIIFNREVVREKALKLINKDSTEPLFTNKLNDKFVKKMLEVARENISNTEFGKDEFASAMNVSSSLLYKKIKSLTDQSPTEFIKAVRLNHAVELLQSKNYTVTEVSELCGFGSVAYFSTVFRKHFGKSPSEILE
ncbi:MAG: response regulator [Prolixibacteraceae bacterium]|nr:response regulator [Prolixibacteraceae bacterium]